MSIDPDSGQTLPDGATSPFPNPCETPLDVDAQAQSRVLQQYRESTKLKGMITDIAELFQALEDVGTQISQQRDPAIAEGVNLDVVGELVGQSRVLRTADGTHTLAIEDGGSYLIGAHTFTGLQLYRLLITWRIARNKAIGSGPEYIAALRAFVFVEQDFVYVHLGNMAMLVETGTGLPPTADQMALLDDGPVPRAMAVGVGRDWYDPASYFAFAEDIGAGAKGFGEIGDATKGGKFAEIF